MGWFDEQIKIRKQNDETCMEDAFAQLSSVIMGKRAANHIKSDREKAKDAIGEILKFYHVKQRELPETLNGINEQLEYLLHPSGIMRRSVKLTAGWYKDSTGPLLGFLKDGSPVALLPRRLSGYQYRDWETGKTVRLTAKTAQALREDAVCFYKPLPLKPLKTIDLLKYILLTLSLSDFMMILSATLSATLLGLLPPYINQIIYGQIIPSGQVGLLLSVFVLLFGVTLSTALINVTKSLILSRISTKMNVAVEAATMARVLSLPASFFKPYSAGDLSSRAGGISRLCEMLANAVLTTGLTSLFSLVYLGQIFSFAPPLAVPSLIITLLNLAVTVGTTLLQLRIARRQMQLGAKNAGLIFSILTGIQKIKLSGAERRAFSRWAGVYKEQAELLYNPPFFLRLSPVFSVAISLAGTIVLYSCAAASQVAIADYMAFNASFGMVSGAMTSLASIALTAAQIKPVMEMVEPILNAQPEIAQGKQVLTRLSGAIELNNLSFRYGEASPMVIDDLSLKIRPGQYVAIVGETGCGKSTLMRLMLGFEKPQKGAVYFDGRDIDKVDLKSLRQHIGVVMQNGKLFQGDLYSNIVISAPWLTLDEAWEAAELAGIADDIRAMPMGMHTILSEGGGGISGGQRQRLMIARAIAPKPKVLIFDEATSALDNITQKKVSESLDRLKSTRIVIAHRLSTIRNCDRILVMEHGKIAADGSFEELMEKSEYFAQLVRRQQMN